MTLRDELQNDPSLVFANNIFYKRALKKESFFEQQYIDLRKKESRLYTDEVAEKLPDIFSDHPLKKEWKIRHSSLKKLLKYLAAVPGEKKILEIGCGNGWLSNHLAQLSNAQVLGIDINETELLQAGRVFGKKKKETLCFAYADITQERILASFDFIILASSMQYFSNVHQLIQQLQNQLKPFGEIHIIDSPIYKSWQVEAARKRSAAYFEKQKISMGYFHHSWSLLDNFKHTVLYDPSGLFNNVTKWITSSSPFPWIRIRK